MFDEGAYSTNAWSGKLVGAGISALALAGIVLGLLSPPSAARGPEAILRLSMTAATSYTMLLMPGFAIGHLRSRRLPLFHLFLPGFFLLLITGSLAWLLASSVRPQITLAAIWIPVISVCLVAALRADWTRLLSAADRKALTIVLLVFLFATGRSLYSEGPKGELYGGTVSRTLEVGNRPDSRISYHLVQLIANGLNPHSELGRRNFLPWSFSDRGPIAGIAVSPTVLLSGAKVPFGTPDQAWVPFDEQGFAAYRLGMIVLATTLLLVIYGAAALVISPRKAVFFVSVVALTPFIIHETFFTWPKLLATSFVLLSGLYLFESKAFLAGLTLGIGFLVHPLALVSLAILPPVLVFRVPATARGTKHLKPRHLGLLVSGLLLVLLSWRLINGAAYSQVFFQYVLDADGLPAESVGVWIKSRVDSFLNTLVPLYLPIFHATNRSVNAIEGTTPSIVHFYFQYWNTLPFGVGIAFFPWLLAALWQFARKSWQIFVAVVVFPLLVFTVFWGSSTSGMLREGLHIWVVTLLLIYAWTQITQPNRPYAGGHRLLSAVLTTRVIETFLMLLLPTWLTTDAFLGERFKSTDVLAILLMGCASLYAARLAWISPMYLVEGQLNP